MHSTLDIQTALPLFIQRCKQAGIRSPEKFLVSKLPSVYDYLLNCFPRGIMPTDVDGEVEVNGNYLRLEFKEEGLVRLSKYPEGQKKAFLRLVKEKQFTLFLIGHDHGGRVKVMRWVKPGASNSFTTGIINPCNEERLAQACRNWVKSINHVYN